MCPVCFLQACPLLVPQHAHRNPGASDADYFQGLGYRLVDDPKKPDTKRLENADEYVSRMTAMVLLYASVVQTESAGNPLPLSHGWTWMARCLNSMPPNRFVRRAGGEWFLSRVWAPA
jgi:nucleoporin GLE1